MAKITGIRLITGIENLLLMTEKSIYNNYSSDFLSKAKIQTFIISSGRMT